MNKKYYYIGKNIIEIDAPDIVQKYMELFCCPNDITSEIVECFLKYEIVEETVERIEEISKKYDNSIKKQYTFNLLNISYKYLENENKYLAGNKFCVGLIDVSKRKIKWYMHISKFFPRSLFHLGILDPYSLLCPKIGEIVVHGSILEKNHKAVLFIGRSGSGKSTVTHKLSKYSEVNKLCDDTFIISFENNKLLAHSIDTGFGYDIDIAKSYIETGLYYELYNWGNKSYIFKKEKYSSVMIEPALIVFLNRIISDEDISSTSIKKITKIELLRFFINNQTNISSPFLIEKMRIYKSISNILPGIYIDFINDCDISNLNDCIKEYLTFI